MMTPTERIAAASNIAAAINRDLDNGAIIRMPHLDTRLDDYLDCPHTPNDRAIIRMMLIRSLPALNARPNNLLIFTA